MSHVTTCELEIKDLDALAAAAQSLGLELVRDQKTYRWYGRFVGDYHDERLAKMGIAPSQFGKCDHVLRLPNANAYEVGVVRNPKGDGYILMYDFYAGGHGLMAAISTDKKSPNKLQQAYATEVAARQLARQGFRVTRTAEGGRIKLTATR